MLQVRDHQIIADNEPPHLLREGQTVYKVVRGDVEHGSVMSGQIAGLVSKEETVEEILKDNRIEVTVRREMGTDINAACGQLRRSYLEENR